MKGLIRSAFDSVSPPQPENISVLFPLLHPKKRKNSWTLPTSSPPFRPSQNQREGRRKKNGRGGAAEVKRVLKMAALPLAAQLHSPVCGRADVPQRGRTGSCVEIKDGCKAPHHQTQLHSTPKRFKTSGRITSSTPSNSLLAVSK